MRPGSRAIAIFVALGLAGLITLILSLIQQQGRSILFAAFLISFLIIFISSILFLEFVYDRELGYLRNLLRRIEEDDLENLQRFRTSTPMKKIYNNIFDYATSKHNEVEDLRRMANFRKEFIADISHELKTPIFAAQGFVHTLLDGAVKDKKVREKFLKKAAKSLDRLDILVQDLMTLSQIETGEVKMFLEYFDALKLCEEVVEQFEEKAKKKDIELSIDHEPGGSYLVYADWHRIYQVLINLISNAIEYTDTEGTVTVQLTDEEDDVTVCIKDTGVGIPAEHLPRIFERFYRVDKSRSRSGGGTGLGLAIVKHIIEAHESTIKVESTEGQGTRFSFRLTKGKD